MDRLDLAPPPRNDRLARKFVRVEGPCDVQLSEFEPPADMKPARGTLKPGRQYEVLFALGRGYRCESAAPCKLIWSDADGVEEVVELDGEFQEFHWFCDRGIVYLEELGLSPGVEASVQEARLKASVSHKTRWLAEAMLLVRDHPEWSNRKIAVAVGKHPGTLSRAPEYKLAAAMARGDKSNIRRGFIRRSDDDEGVDLEAYSDD